MLEKVLESGPLICAADGVRWRASLWAASGLLTRACHVEIMAEHVHARANTVVRRSGATAFATTHWSVVLQAGQSDSPAAEAALERLCQTYWLPLYDYVRRGRSEMDAQDLTQQFFAHFLERKYFRVADRQRGKFRSFLLTCLKHFLAHERERFRAVKRGGTLTFIAWEDLDQEKITDLANCAGKTPEQIYDRQWALTVMDQALSKLRDEFVTAEKRRDFELFKEFLTRDPPDGTYPQIADLIGTKANAVAVAVHRFRQRYRDLVRQEVAHTVANPADIEDELRNLLRLLVS
jgi:RNA polymerase sigma-70 factor (ECF subfamily)